VSHRALLRLLINETNRQVLTVRENLESNPVTVSPATSTLEAIEVMRTNRVGCLPVTENDQLVGIVTSYDFLEASAELFEEHLRKPSKPQHRIKAAASGRA
jgi:CBS domain-containing protein